MPTKALRPCRYPGCAALTSGGYCLLHKKQNAARYDSLRGTAPERGYDARWRKIRLIKIQSDPVCEMCLKDGKARPATIVHHIDGNAHNNIEHNLMSVCASCHERLHDRR